jgi:prephenate dehydrogenase
MSLPETKKLRHVTIIGVGLLGGSLGLAVKARNPRVRIAGVGRRMESLKEALEVGAIDTAHLDAREPAARTDLLVLATPVCAFERHLRAVAPVLPGRAVVTDVGSTKALVVRAARRILGARGPFVGSHPMAGSERKGVAFARADLLEGATCVLTPTATTPPGLVRRLERFWRELGMRTVRMAPAAHDDAMARVSHLPHLLAGLLMTLARRGDLDVSAGGFRDATRMAGGDPEMWRDILLTNRGAILDAIDDLDESLIHLRDLIDLGDADGIEKFLSAAKARRDETVSARNNRSPGE